MSVEITGGGAIAVDPDEMRAVADRMAATAARLSAAADDLRRAHHALSSTWSAGGRVDAGGLAATAHRTAEDADELAGDARGTAIMADAFELADLRSEQQLLAVEHPVEAGLPQGRIDELVASYPELDTMALQMTVGWERSSVEGLMDAPVDRAMGFLLDTSLGVPMWLLAPLLQRIAAETGGKFVTAGGRERACEGKESSARWAWRSRHAWLSAWNATVRPAAAAATSARRTRVMSRTRRSPVVAPR